MAKKVRPNSPLNSVSLKEELAAALAARRELGEQYEDHVAAALAERIDFPYRSARAGRNEPNTQAGEVGLRSLSQGGDACIGLWRSADNCRRDRGRIGRLFAVLGMIFVINVLWLWRSR